MGNGHLETKTESAIQEAKEVELKSNETEAKECETVGASATEIKVETTHESETVEIPEVRAAEAKSESETFEVKEMEIKSESETAEIKEAENKDLNETSDVVSAEKDKDANETTNEKDETHAKSQEPVDDQSEVSFKSLF